MLTSPLRCLLGVQGPRPLLEGSLASGNRPSCFPGYSILQACHAETLYSMTVTSKAPSKPAIRIRIFLPLRHVVSCTWALTSIYNMHYIYSQCVHLTICHITHKAYDGARKGARCKCCRRIPLVHQGSHARCDACKSHLKRHRNMSSSSKEISPQCCQGCKKREHPALHDACCATVAEAQGWAADRHPLAKPISRHAHP